MSYRFTILGCGPSGGVPRLGPHWGRCDPENPKNRRRRCSVLVDRFDGKGGRTSILIDTPPDLREQLIDARVTSLDAVFYTHDHADHTHGIDDLRMVHFAMKRRVEVYADEHTIDSLTDRFAYCFATREGSEYKPIMTATKIEPTQHLTISGEGGEIAADVIAQMHGKMPTIGFRFGDLGYTPDISSMPDESIEAMQGLDVWIVDALRYSAHPSHFNVKQALEWIDKLKPKRAILTHMTTELDYDTLRRDLPDHVEPAYDGMEIVFEGRGS